MEVATQIVMRVTAGYSYDEIAELLDDHRDNIRYLELPKGPVTKTWIAARIRELRKEIEETSGAA